MRHFFGITIALLATFSWHGLAQANCGKTSAFRYEFESWMRRYVLAFIGRTSESIGNIFTITLSELELDKDQEVAYQQTLNDWNSLSEKCVRPKADIAEIVEEFRLKFKKFVDQRHVLHVIATKNIKKAINDIPNVTEAVSQEYANEILMDWKLFRMAQDFETLAQQEDCKEINEIMLNLSNAKDKEIPLGTMSRALFEVFGMSKWSLLFTASGEDNFL